MSLMVRPCLLAASVVIVLGQFAHAEDKTLKGDLAKLQGVWRGKTGSNGQLDTVMIIKGDAGTMDNTLQSGKRVGLTYKILIDEEAKPHKTIDSFDILRYGTDRTGGARHVYGIYKFLD